ncbi:GGDEF domain-containing protein [Halarcobacter sp.]|uniref:GGDEF domain-containing protein n=1 Tax=Halarcobacter sp. TaxID=2321133 RepID=UPI0029F59063|nr:GGDEF domain-containing protein [Halarcobacter sp.]
MQENRLFEALLDVIPFAAYAVDVETYEVVYANKMMSESLFAPREEFCWKKVFGQEEICSWCKVPDLKQRSRQYKNEKLISSFFDEATDKWFQAFDELISWPDGRTVKYTILVDISEQKEIQASMIKTHAKLAIQSKKLQQANKKLKYLSEKDYLTGIDNRRSYFKKGIELFEASLDEPYDLYVAMLDLDRFKSINDTYGHNIGDEVLKEFTQTIELLLDENDIFGRLGGEEFSIILVSDNQDDVIAKLETIKNKIKAIDLKVDDKSVNVSVSIGFDKKIATDKSLDILLERADKYLYEAKNEGRDKLKFRV